MNSATGEQVGVTPFSDGADVDGAVAATREAFEDWSARPVEERIQLLFELKALLETPHCRVTQL